MILTLLHGGNTKNIPIRKITVELFCARKCYFNHSITQIQKKRIELYRENENWKMLAIYSLAFIKNEKKTNNVISFSLQIFNKRIIHEIESTASSGNILTWINQRGDKMSENLLSSLREVYKYKREIAFAKRSYPKVCLKYKFWIMNKNHFFIKSN